MNNIDFIGGASKIKIPQGFFDIPDECIVKEGDKIAMLSITDIAKKTHSLSWIKPDSTEIGKLKKYAGRVVIRQIQN